MSNERENAEITQQGKATDSEKRVRKLHRLSVEHYAAGEQDFFFTINAQRGKAPFTDAHLAEAIVESLLWRKKTHDWTLYCYCLMPDHLHFILHLPPMDTELMNAGARGIVPRGVLDQIGDYKKYTTTQVWWKQGGRGPLWQKSSYDRILRYNTLIEPAVSYVLNNPVRKGLVERWEDYPFSRIVDPW